MIGRRIGEPLRWSFRLLSLAVVFAASVTTAQAEGAEFQQALRDYHSGFYATAITRLQRICRQDPSNANAHYCLGNVYLKLSQTDRAIEQYRLALNFSHDPATVDYCRKALLALSRQTAAPGSGLLAGTSTPVPLPASFDRSLSAQALRRIEEQSKETTARFEANSNLLKQQQQQQGTMEAQRIRQESAIVEKQMQDAQVVSHKGKVATTIPLYSQAEIDAKKAWYEVQAKEAEALAQKQLAITAESMKRRQEAVEESAASLRSQLSRTPSLSDSTAIEPLGTNLFVRNYQPISRMLDNIPPVDPVRAKSESVNPKSATADKIGPTARTAPELGTQDLASNHGPAGEKRVRTAVRGRLLK